MLNYVLTTMLNRIIDANLFNDNFDFDRANAFYPSSDEFSVYPKL